MAIRKYMDLTNFLYENKFVFEECDLNDKLCVICNGILKNATQSTCGCTFCFDCIKNYLGSDHKSCPSNRASCSKELLSMSADIQIDHRANRSIALLKVKCPNEDCSIRDCLAGMVDHVRICEKGSVRCPYSSLGCSESSITKNNLVNHLNNNIHGHGTMVTESIENIVNELSSITQLKNYIANIEVKERTLTEQVEEQRLEIEKLKSNNLSLSQTVEEFVNTKKKSFYQDLIGQVENLETRVSKISCHTIKSDDYVWKVDDFGLKRNAILSIFKKEISSRPFYTHKGGYRMRLKMYPNGYGSGLNTHLFVSFCLMKGDFDDHLGWPFKHLVNLSLVDQNSGQEHKSFSFRLDSVVGEFKEAFHKPKSQMNRSLGDDEFITFEELYAHEGLVKNDSIVLKCSVNMS